MISLKFTTLIDKHNYDCIFGYLSWGVYYNASNLYDSYISFILLKCLSILVPTPINSVNLATLTPLCTLPPIQPISQSLLKSLPSPKRCS